MVVDRAHQLAAGRYAVGAGVYRRQHGFGAGAGFYPAAAAALYRLTGGHPDPVHHLRRRHRQSSRVYAFWVLGQLVLGAVGLLVLPPLFAHFGLMAVYLILAAIMLCCLPLIPAFPNGFTAARTARSGPAASPARKLCAVLAVLTFTSA